MSRVALLSLVLSLAGCAVPYVPEPVRHDLPLPQDAFDIVLAVFRDRFPRITAADREAFRIQSAWIPMQHGDVPGDRRGSVYRDADGRLRVVIEIRFVEFRATGLEYSRVEGDTRAERELAAALEHALGG
jgi:hypothetical protein